MKRAPVLLLAGLIGNALRPCPLSAQALEVRPTQARGRLGDVVTLEVVARLPAGMELIDVVPRPLVALPRGIRLVAADTLRPGRDGTWRGSATIAFYRLGPQPVPTLALLYRRGAGEPPDTLVHLPVSVEITPVLPAGNPPLKDIKPLRTVGAPLWGPLVALLALLAAGLWWLRRRSRLGGPSAGRLDSAPATGPFERAFAKLDQIERVARASGNGILPIYAHSAEVVRHLLLEIGAIPHHGLTTPEVSRTLPVPLTAGDLRRDCEALLGDSDLVKFARVRPDFAAAMGQLDRTRELLEAWRSALSPAAEPASRRAAE
jgi:hypothetical protein